MMQLVVFNPFSAMNQCHTIQELTEVVSSTIGCFEYLLPALKVGKIKLLYDSRIESRSLVPGQFLNASIGQLRGTSEQGADIVKKWYLYSRNRADDVTDQGLLVKLSCPSTSFPEFEDSISTLYLNSQAHWISFGKCAIGTAPLYRISATDAEHVNTNIHDVAEIRNLLPRYEASPKHRAEAYYDHARGEEVAPMQLDAKAAQALLLESREVGGDFFGREASSGRLYRFKPTVGNVFHGFEVRIEEIPPELLTNGKFQ